MKTQLLCTFAETDNLQDILQKVRENYKIVYNYIYVLQNKTNIEELYMPQITNLKESSSLAREREYGILEKMRNLKHYPVRYTLNMEAERGGLKISQFSLVLYSQE
ncbi:hypothetical protein EB169_03360 [archaeon]|nr:hypothetical protein [archaeon]